MQIALEKAALLWVVLWFFPGIVEPVPDRFFQRGVDPYRRYVASESLGEGAHPGKRRFTRGRPVGPDNDAQRASPFPSFHFGGFLARHQHGTGRRFHHTLGNTAEEEARCSFPPVSADDDQLNVIGARGLYSP